MSRRLLLIWLVTINMAFTGNYQAVDSTIDATDLPPLQDVSPASMNAWRDSYTNPAVMNDVDAPPAVLSTLTNALNPPSGTSGLTPPTTAQATQAAGGSTNAPGTTDVGNATGTPGSWQDYFARGVIIVLGFIFVAVGLSLFREPLAMQVVDKVKP